MKKILSVVFIVSLFMACEKDVTTSDADILAIINEDVITTKDFVLNYEFGFASVKRGIETKQEYLDLMITEKLMAEEGYSLRLDTMKSVQSGLQIMEEEALIEEVFDHFVMDRITVSDDEIKEEINKAAVSFKLSIIPAENEYNAGIIRDQITSLGFEGFISQYKNEMMQGDIKPEDFTTPYISYDQIDNDLLVQIEELELRTPSEPVQLNGQWLVVLVDNIKRSPIAPEDYEQKAETYRKVVYNRKAMQKAGSFVEDVMSDKDVRTKRDAFEPLVTAMYKWYSHETPSGDLVAQVRQGTGDYHSEIQPILNQTLVESVDFSWTVEEFLRVFTPGRYPIRAMDGFARFKNGFADVTGLVVRDYYLMKIGREENIDESADYKKQVQQWTDKWVFQETRGHILDRSDFTDAEVQKYFDKYKETFDSPVSEAGYDALSSQLKDRVRRQYLNHLLKTFADSLKDHYPITIYYEKLDTLKLPSATGTDIQVQLFKQNSNRMAFPVVDPNW